IGETLDRLLGERDGLVEPARLAACFEQRDRRLQQERVVLQEGGDLRLATVVGTQQASVLVAHVARQELGAPGGGGEQLLARGHRFAARVCDRPRGGVRERGARIG